MNRLRILLGIAAIVIVILVCWMIIPGQAERRFDQIQIGMSENVVQNIMDSNGDSVGKKFRITGDKRQRVWVVHEKLRQIEIVIVLDKDSRVAGKEIYKSSTILNSFGE